MTLAPGTRLGPYEISAPLGAGGMGEVYRARDPKLARDVAVKVLPEALASEAGALERFEREARAVAALSHPHILAIHDFGRENGVAYAVMELLEGETLRARLAAGPLPQRKARDLANDIAQGLAAAHEKGIVHRDLKPENLFVTKGGRVKILDFGLARQLAPQASGSDTQSPTVPRQTDPGTVLGTVGYMSPEQVKGLPADARSDIFSFGAVLYEMLTGRRAFQKETAAETMTAILREEPPEPSATGAHLSPALERIVRHCLEKEPDERFRSAHDLAFALEAVGGSSAAAQAPITRSGPRRVPLAAAAAAAVLALAAGVLAGRLSRRAPAPSLVAIKPLTHSGKDTDLAVSPDRRTIAFSSSRDGVSRIWVKQLASGDEVALSSGPDSAPRFSPDGAQILFSRGSQGMGVFGAYVLTTSDVFRMPVLGGPARRVAALGTDAEWSPDGRTIVFVRMENASTGPRAAIYSVSPEGGTPKELARRDGRLLASPRFSPDGTTLIFASAPGLGNAGAMYELIGLDGSPRGSVQVPPTLGFSSGPAWVDSGRAILYAQSLSVRFGASRLIRQSLGANDATPLLWMPFEASMLESLGDGRLAAASRSSRENLLEVSLAEPGAPPRWLTRGTSTDRQPSFSPDGEWIAFSSTRSGNLDIWEVSAKTGAIRRITEHEADDWDPGFLRDGHPIWSSGRAGHLEIWTAEPDGGSPRQVSHDGVDAENPTATADGWIYYASANSDRDGLWRVRADGSGAARIGRCDNLPEVSPDGLTVACPDLGNGPIRFLDARTGEVLPLVIETPHPRATEIQMGRQRWSPDGRRVYFIAQDEKGATGIFAQDFDRSAKDTSASRRKVAGFDATWDAESFAISPDGRTLVLAALERLYGIVTIEGIEAARPR